MLDHFITALLLVFAITLACSAHMYFVTHDYLAQCKIPINSALFGRNKTWRSFIFLPLLTALCMLIILPFRQLITIPFGQGILPLFFFGLLCGIFYLLGELPNSFVKRRLKISEGTLPSKHRFWWILADQFDSLFAIVIGFNLVYSVPLAVTLFVLF